MDNTNKNSVDSSKKVYNDEIKNEIIKKKLNEINLSKDKNKFKFLKITKETWVIGSFLAAASALGFLGGLIAVNVSNKNWTQKTSISQIENSADETNNDVVYESQTGEASTYLSITSIAERNIKSVAEINTETAKTDKSLKQFTSAGAGSGIVISADGYIMTNNHVISSANKISATVNGESFEASIVGADTELDIALLKIEKYDLQPVIFGDSSNIKIGENVVAIGNPLGQLGGTVTKGIISALNRDITINNETMNLLQTDTALNPGNSGGGLFNLRGELIGMVVAKSKSASAEGIGFAIPVNNLKKPLNDLKEFGYIRGKIDIEMGITDASMLKSSNLYKNYTKGVFITKIPDESNAKSAGLQSGDCIVSIDSQDINNITSLNRTLRNYSAGDTVSVGIMRKDETLTLTLQLAEKK